MADVVIMDSSPVEGSSQSEKKAKRSLKRKRASLVPENVSAEERETKIDELSRELKSLFQYYKEGLSQKVHFEEKESGSVGNSVFACLLEESDIPFSKLVDEIYEKLKGKDGVTLASVRSKVLLIGQRSMYGIANADADVLEDDSENCLWCWETRDLKLLPTIQREALKIRRVCRKKIHERITVVSSTIAALRMPPSHPNYKNDLMKSSEKLVKVLNESEIRLLVENMVQKNGADMAEKEAKLKEKDLTKELERNKREVEKEKKRMDREQQKDKLQSEKEIKRLQDEAEKEARRREKEEAEMKKQLKRQQEEAEKEQRRQADLKKQCVTKKQATFMKRFLNSAKNDTSKQDDMSSTKSLTSDSSKEREEHKPNDVTLSMDRALSSEDGIDTNAIWKSHIDAWNRFGRSSRSGSSQHWGMRLKPKTPFIKELKLHGSSSEAAGHSAKVVASNKGVMNRNEMNIDTLDDEWEETIPVDKSCNDNAADVRICSRIKKLLQFDKSNRPAYYGTLSKKSNFVGPRHPFKKDPDLDYDIESDEEWEEEDPGESLSDCDKDGEEDILEEGNLRAEDEDGSEDGFLVPDGYLSENEGVHVDSMEVDCVDDEARSSPRCKEDVESEEFRILLRHQKYINRLTERALQKNQPLIVTNLMHEKATLLTAEGLNGTPKIEQMFLQSLSLRPFHGDAPIHILMGNSKSEEDQEVCQSHSKGHAAPATPATPVSVIQDEDLPKIVSAIQSHPKRINEVMESLQQSLPNIPKSQLKNKVREMAHFVDNRWQVKQEIKDKLGLSISPEKCSGGMKSIATFFSKRCLPPAKTDKSSPQPCRKPETVTSEHGCTQNLL